MPDSTKGRHARARFSTSSSGVRIACGSGEVCSQVSFKDRDSVGARNILRCLAERERPKSLTRINGSGALKLTNFVLRTGAIGSTAA